MNTDQSFIQECLNTINFANQWALTSRANQTIILNTFSCDQFYPYKLVPQSHRKQYKEFQQRQKYSFPHTPKIVLIKNTSKPNQQMLLLAQKGQYQFKKFIAHFSNDQKNQLELTLKIVNTAEMLQKKYGYFRLTPSMIRASKGPSLLVWINQNQASNNPQYPIDFVPINLQGRVNKFQQQLNPQEIMIRSILKILLSVFTRNMFLSQIFREQQHFTFENIKKILNQQIRSQSNSACVIGKPLEQKKRYLSQKRKNIPSFLLNRTISKDHDKEKEKKMLQTFNKKSAVTYSLHQNKSQVSNLSIVKKVSACQYASEKRKPQQQIKQILQKFGKSSNRIKDTRTQQNQPMSYNVIKHPQQKLRLSQPSQPSHKVCQIIKIQQYKNDDKKNIRQSGDTISTSAHQYFSVHSSSGNRTMLNSQDDNRLSFKKKDCQFNSKDQADQSLLNTKANRKRQQDQQLNKFIRVSKIIQEKVEQSRIINRVALNSTPRSPSIMLGIIGNNSRITQNSVLTPGQQFYKDIDFILHSGSISRNIQSEMDHSVQVQFNKILFD